MSSLQTDTQFEKELASLLNRFSLEKASNTPDYILAEFLKNCLDAFNYAARSRENWYDRSLAVGGAVAQKVELTDDQRSRLTVDVDRIPA